MTSNEELLRESAAAWEAELRSGAHGQDRHRPGTWDNSALYRAVCCEYNARDWDAIHPPAAEEWRRRGVHYLTEGL